MGHRRSVGRWRHRRCSQPRWRAVTLVLLAGLGAVWWLGRYHPAFSRAQFLQADSPWKPINIDDHAAGEAEAVCGSGNVPLPSPNKNGGPVRFLRRAQEISHQNKAIGKAYGPSSDQQGNRIAPAEFVPEMPIAFTQKRIAKRSLTTGSVTFPGESMCTFSQRRIAPKLLSVLPPATVHQ